MNATDEDFFEEDQPSSCSHDWDSQRPHCRRCCLTFTGMTAFDKHIVFNEHVPPDQRGMVQVRPGVWGNPPTEAGKQYWEARKREKAGNG